MQLPKLPGIALRAVRAGTSGIIAALALSACGNDNLIGGSTSGTPPTSPATGNHAPSITGTPPSTARVNQAYNFQPNAFDADGDTLRFEITGKPAWALFNANTGRLYGTPPTGTTGTFGGIEIRVTDGAATAKLPVSAVQVLDGTGGTSGSAVLSWSRPARNSDGTTLANLAGYRIYYGPSPSQTSTTVVISDPAATSATINGLAAGTWYFAITSYTTAGTESSRTAQVSVTIS